MIYTKSEIHSAFPGDNIFYANGVMDMVTEIGVNPYGSRAYTITKPVAVFKFKRWVPKRSCVMSGPPKHYKVWH